MLKKNTNKFIILSFVILHLVLININVAEWGDSYRILRASNYIRIDNSYPNDEKRPPLFSTALALRPDNFDPIVWGRLFMFGVSLTAVYVYTKLLDLLKIKNKSSALLLLLLNPVYLYWSIRIYADVPFSLLVMLAFYLLYKKKNLLLGVIVGLAILTRFEGYILGLAIGVHLVFINKKSSDLIKFGVASFLTVLPWWVYRDPFSSTYFGESSGRVYDAKMLWVFVASLIFSFGFIPIASSFKKINIKKYLGIIVFVILELLLAVLWPAAIPRLFVPVIPFLAMYLSESLVEMPNNNKLVLFNFLLLIFYIVSQYFLKLQFLILFRNVLYVVVGLQIVMLVAQYFNKRNLFLTLSALSMFIWSISTIILHKDIFIAVKNAAEYARDNLDGRIAYNDVSSISDWYLGDRGVYLNMDSKNGRTQAILKEKNVNYLLITNEHNQNMEIDLSEVEYLEEIKEFRYNIRGTEFFTKIIKLKT